MKRCRVAPGLGLAFLFLFGSVTAQAACVRVACYQVSGAVESCRPLRRDGQAYLHLRIPRADATQIECDVPPARPSTPQEIEDGIAWFRARSDYYLEGSAAVCSTLVGAEFTGELSGLCCDTLPAAGACTLDGPLLIEVTR